MQIDNFEADLLKESLEYALTQRGTSMKKARAMIELYEKIEAEQTTLTKDL